MSVQRHTIYNVLGAVLPIGVSLLTVPAYLHTIGEARYGILSIVWLLLGYFGLFDLGLGMATSQQIAARRSEGRARQAQIFWTALMTNFGLGVAGGLIAWPVAQYYFGHVMNVDSALREEMVAAIPWLMSAVPLATVTGVATGALQGLERFGTLNIISATGTVLFQLLPLATAMFWTPALPVILPAALISRAFTLLLLSIECRRTLLANQPIAFSRKDVSILLHFGLWLTVSAFFAPFAVMVDRLAIGALISASAVSIYVVPFSVGERLCILANSAGSALYPRFASLQKPDATELSYNSERVLMALMLIVAVAAIFLISPFLALWIGRDFANKASLAGQIIMVGVWFEAVSRIPLYGLRGQFRNKAVAAIDLIQLVPVWIVLYVLLVHFGVAGAAVAYVFRSGLNYALLTAAIGNLGRIKWHLASNFAALSLCVVLVRIVQPLTMNWAYALLFSLVMSALIAWYLLPANVRSRLVARLPR